MCRHLSPRGHRWIGPFEIQVAVIASLELVTATFNYLREPPAMHSYVDISVKITKTRCNKGLGRKAVFIIVSNEVNIRRNKYLISINLYEVCYRIIKNIELKEKSSDYLVNVNIYIHLIIYLYM